MFCFGYSDEGNDRCRSIDGGIRIHQGVSVGANDEDVKITQIYEGTNQIQRLIIAKQILGG